MKFWKKCPLFLLLLLSGCLLSAAGYAGADSIYSDYGNDSGIAAGISSVFRGWKDGVYPWMLMTKNEIQASDLPETAEEFIAEYDESNSGLIVPAESHGPMYDKFGVLISDEVVSMEEEIQNNEMPEAEEPAVPVIQEEPEQISVSENTVPASEFPEMEELVEENRTFEFTTVGEEYFDDALFIGDSRTVGLASYAGFQEETDFWAATSSTIYHIFEQPKKIAVLDDGRKTTVEEALREKQYGKIYIMLGINELGRGTTSSFFTAYAETVNQIRLLQPDAIIFVQGIMRVSTEKSRTDSLFKNETINDRNNALAMMANNQDIFYLEVNDAVCDESGGLIREYTYDQVHLKAKYYQLWKEYLLSHGIVKE